MIGSVECDALEVQGALTLSVGALREAYEGAIPGAFVGATRDRR
jgi:hypothetical protein